jgi:hypothetical protein
MKISSIAFAICLAILLLISGLLGNKELSYTQLIIALISASLGGFLFYKIMKIISTYVEKVVSTKFEGLNSEPANLYYNIFNSIGGILEISPNFLIFKSHSFNLKNELIQIPFKSIKRVEPFFLFGQLKGLKIFTEEKCVRFILKSNRALPILDEIKTILESAVLRDMK